MRRRKVRRCNPAGCEPSDSTVATAILVTRTLEKPPTASVRRPRIRFLPTNDRHSASCYLTSDHAVIPHSRGSSAELTFRPLQEKEIPGRLLGYRVSAICGHFLDRRYLVPFFEGSLELEELRLFRGESGNKAQSKGLSHKLTKA
ncbi:unnamed protein product [Protopolystoma xenopodis]|uniref:Uncharacterized protein n=1 Tax=Protopolystoma xenopodis TaxID=117903 RepID=A0A448WG69_9PLAT|nr:unnamed protein product [Protopolystoma xenopodis]